MKRKAFGAHIYFLLFTGSIESRSLILHLTSKVPPILKVQHEDQFFTRVGRVRIWGGGVVPYRASRPCSVDCAEPIQLFDQPCTFIKKMFMKHSSLLTVIFTDSCAICSRLYKVIHVQLSLRLLVTSLKEGGLRRGIGWLDGHLTVTQV